MIVGTQVDLRDDPSTIEKLNRNKQKAISVEAGMSLNQIRAANTIFRRQVGQGVECREVCRVLGFDTEGVEKCFR